MDTSSILLIYKGKVLLLLTEYMPFNKSSNIWSFIYTNTIDMVSAEKAIVSEVEHETGIQLKTVKHITNISYNGKRKYFYYAKLTDYEVNNMKRLEGKTLQFFSIKELDTLALTLLAKLFLLKNKGFLNEIPYNL